MKRFDHVLDENERWDTAFFLWSLRAESEDLSVGAEVYTAACSRCHGTDGRNILTAPLDRPDRAKDSRLDLANRIESAHPELLLGRTQSESSALIEYLYTFLYSPDPVSVEDDSRR